MLRHLVQSLVGYISIELSSSAPFSHTYFNGLENLLFGVEIRERSFDADLTQR